MAAEHERVFGMKDRTKDVKLRNSSRNANNHERVHCASGAAYGQDKLRRAAIVIVVLEINDRLRGASSNTLLEFARRLRPIRLPPRKFAL